jgi:hypothetical protein
MRSYRGIRSVATPPTLLLILNTPSATSSTTTTFASMENVRVYLVITISTRVNIVYKRVAKVVKDIRAIGY